MNLPVGRKAKIGKWNKKKSGSRLPNALLFPKNMENEYPPRQSKVKQCSMEIWGWGLFVFVSHLFGFLYCQFVQWGEEGIRGCSG